MKLYHISQSEAKGYDTYSDIVVCAESEDEARMIHPRGYCYDHPDDAWKQYPFKDDSWCSESSSVNVEYLGEAASHLKKGIICSSFHAG